MAFWTWEEPSPQTAPMSTGLGWPLSSISISSHRDRDFSRLESILDRHQKTGIRSGSNELSSKGKEREHESRLGEHVCLSQKGLDGIEIDEIGVIWNEGGCRRDTDQTVWSERDAKERVEDE